jgi:serine/threonine-protein kinase
VREDIPELLEAICMKALAHERDQRFATAEEMQRALEAALEKLGERPQLRAVGDLMTKAFAEERLRIRSVIEAEMSNVRTTGTYPAPDLGLAGKTDGRLTLPRLLEAVPTTGSGSFNSNAGSATGAESGSEPNTALSRVSSLTANNLLAVNTPPPAPAKKPIGLYAVVGIAVAVAVAALAWPRAPAPTTTSLNAVNPVVRMIRIESTPPGATVRENDKVLGQTPMAIPIDPAQQSARRLVLSLDGYAPYTVHQGPSLEDVRVLVPLTMAVAAEVKATAEPTATAHVKAAPALSGRLQGPATTTPKAPSPSPLDINMNR